MTSRSPLRRNRTQQLSTVTIESFDGFTYALRIGQLKGETLPVTVSVEAQRPAPTPTPSPNDKGSEPGRSLAEKLATEKKFAVRSFLLNKFPPRQMLKDRAALLKPPLSPTPSPTPTPRSSLAPR